MQWAYWFNKNNEHEEVKASNLSLTSSISFYCIACHTRVQLVNGKNNYFRHAWGTYKKECEHYASAEQKIIKSTYEGKKSTLFLVSSFDHYRLAIGLPNISETVLIEAENEDLRINIKTGLNSEFDIQVSRRYFSPSCYHYVYLDCLRDQYAVSFNLERVPPEIINRWTDTISGVRKEGVIFKKSDFACEKVSTKDGVYTGESYLFLTAKSLDHKSILGADFKLVQEMKFSNSSFLKYEVFEVAIHEKTSDVELFFATFGLKVQKAQKQHMVLWPPTIEEEESLLLNASSEIFLLYNSEEILSIPFDQNVEIMPLQNGMTFKVDEERFQLIEQVHLDLEVLQSYNNKITKELIRKCYIKKFKSNLLTDFRIEKEQLTEHSTLGVDRIEYLIGTDVVAVYVKNDNRTKCTLSKHQDMTLLRSIKQIKGNPTSISSKTLWSIYVLKKYEETYNYLKLLVSMDKMTDTLSKYIERIAKGENHG